MGWGWFASEKSGAAINSEETARMQPEAMLK